MGLCAGPYPGKIVRDHQAYAQASRIGINRGLYLLLLSNRQFAKIPVLPSIFMWYNFVAY